MTEIESLALKHIFSMFSLIIEAIRESVHQKTLESLVNLRML